MGDSFQPGIIYLSVYVFYQESIYSVLDTHLRVTPQGTVAVYNVTWMFDIFSPIVCQLLFQTLKSREIKSNLFLLPSPISKRQFKTCG